MKALVLDTSTLILLAKIDLLEHLSQGVTVWIPQAAAEEATRKTDLPDVKYIERLMKQGLIQVDRKEDPLAHTLEEDFRLGRGEAQAIALAKRKELPLGVDDGLAMKACKAAGVPFVTAMALLVRTYEKRKISQPQALGRLERLKKYGWYHPSILSEAQKEIKGGKAP